AVPPRAGLRFYLRLGANLLSPLPYSVATHQSRALRRALGRLAAVGGVGPWHCAWTPHSAALPGPAPPPPGAPPPPPTLAPPPPLLGGHAPAPRPRPRSRPPGCGRRRGPVALRRAPLGGAAAGPGRAAPGRRSDAA